MKSSAFLCFALMTAFSQEAAPLLAPGTTGEQAAAQPAPATKPALANGLYATIKTSMGDIKVQLFEKESPLAVKNFVGLSTGTKTWTDPRTGQPTRKPLYNGTTFHRVIPDFMIQGGDPLGNGRGEPGYVFKNENTPGLTFDRKGRLAMANRGPDTNGSQFFITVAPYPYLNGGYTIFGQVIEGQEVADKISQVPRNSEDKPLSPVTIQRIVIARVGPAPAAAPAHRTTTVHKASTTAPQKTTQ
jgi:peptidyl-prolyl cis-trans isomerase A (cyclophilin A)